MFLRFHVALHTLVVRNKKLLVTKGIATSNKSIAINNKKLLGAKGIATRSKDATRGSWHRHSEHSYY